MKLKELLPLVEHWVAVNAYLGGKEVNVDDNRERTIKSIYPDLDDIAVELEEHYET